MAEKLDMSLDDIIKQNKTSNQSSRPRRSRGRGRGQFRGRSSYEGVRGGGVQKRSYDSFNRQSRQMDDRWQHDMYDDESPAPSRRPLYSGAGGGGSAKLTITNLDYGVSDDDLKELFSEFGDLKKSAVHYDASGRSLGTAEVIYHRRSDAEKALKQYNGVPLDGKPMELELVGAPAVERAGARSRLDYVPPPRRYNDNFDRPRGRGGRGFGAPRGRGSRGGRGGGRGGRGDRAPTKTAEELDAELDAYKSQMETE